MTDLPIRHAVVTGASSGIGRAIAARLASEGANVVAIGRDPGRLAELVAAAPDGRVRPLSLDLERADDVQRVVGELADALPELDLLVHSAGAYARGALADTSERDLERQLAVNLTAPHRLTRMLMPSLGRARGQVAFVNSSAVLRAQPLLGGYAASKAALRALADSLRDEVNPLGIRVVSIFPGRTDTPLQAQIHELQGRPYEADRLLAPDDVASAVLFAVHMPRSAEVTEIMLRPMLPPA
jgi:NAD(P)-dependent dehydrogenase (short-subunit alcohol dehydrogenase family)